MAFSVYMAGMQSGQTYVGIDSKTRKAVVCCALQTINVCATNIVAEEEPFFSPNAVCYLLTQEINQVILLPVGFFLPQSAYECSPMPLSTQASADT